MEKEFICKLCGKQVEVRSVYRDKEMQVFQCKRCGLLCQENQNRIVGSNYYQDRYTGHQLDWSGKTIKLRDVIERIIQDYPSGKLLDVGCSGGEFINELSKQGMESIRVQPNLM
jgi:2-polyprenyl-3-methyl-5-hydroxy-6-metoxy-1,4-benzoquinol methylase